MTYYKNKKSGKTYILLAYAIDSTNERNGLPVIIYCPDDNEHSIYVKEESEFMEKFELIKKEAEIWNGHLLEDQSMKSW